MQLRTFNESSSLVGGQEYVTYETKPSHVKRKEIIFQSITDNNEVNDLPPRRQNMKFEVYHSSEDGSENRQLVDFDLPVGKNNILILQTLILTFLAKRVRCALDLMPLERR